MSFIKERTEKNFFLDEFEYKQTHLPFLCTFINVYSYLKFKNNFDILYHFDRIYFDGIILLVTCKLLGLKDIRRFSFDMSSIAHQVFQKIQNQKKTIFIIGSDAKTIPKSIKNIKEIYHDINIIGFRNGYFHSLKERQFVMDNIIKKNPDFVVVGMGAPLQEQFLIDLKNSGWKGVGFTCGGFLHQIKKGLNYYPLWIDKMNVRWLYRIFDEPLLISRYLIYYPIGLFYFLKAHLKKNHSSKN